MSKEFACLKIFHLLFESSPFPTTSLCIIKKDLDKTCHEIDRKLRDKSVEERERMKTREAGHSLVFFYSFS